MHLTSNILSKQIALFFLMVSSITLNNITVEDIDAIELLPKNEKDIEQGKSCYEKDGTLKSGWKRWLGL